MAAGDVKSALSAVGAGLYLDIKPGAGEEWCVHNIHHEADAELYFSDGSNRIKVVPSDSDQGSWPNYVFHLTNTIYLQVKNTNAGSKLVGYDGVQTK